MPQELYTYDPELTAVTNAIQNEAFIMDEVLPMVPIGQSVFSYNTWPRGQFFQMAEDAIGKLGDPNVVTFSGDRKEDHVNGYALATRVAQQDQSAVRGLTGQDRQFQVDPLSQHTEFLANMLMLRKEKRGADLVFDTSNYPSSQRTTLTGTEQWDDPGSDPVKKVNRTKDKMVMRPNIMVVGREVATELIHHPAIVQAFNSNEGDQGRVPLSFVAQQMELDRILVGEAWYNDAAKNADPSLARVWGKRAALLHVNSQWMMSGPDGDVIYIPTWGFQPYWPVRGAMWGSYSWFDPKPGTEGANWVKTSGRYRHFVVAEDFGWLFVDAVS
jgi:hypothetical protein